MSRFDLAEGQKIAAVATGITLALAGIKALIGYYSGSVALLADSVHTAADTIAIFACWFGLKLAGRPPTEKFPYGFHRAETLASLIASGFIIYAGVSLFLEGVRRIGSLPQLDYPAGAMGVAAMSALVSFFIARYEKRVGKAIFSQSLQANADESRADVLTSILVFVALTASYFQIKCIEPLLAMGISALIIWIGLKNARIGIYS